MNQINQFSFQIISSLGSSVNLFLEYVHSCLEHKTNFECTKIAHASMYIIYIQIIPNTM